MASSEINPLTGRKFKTGGRQRGTANASTTKRHEAMARVNEALAAMGQDTLTGSKLLREVLNHPDTPLDVKIQCAGLVLKQESPTAENQNYVAVMPPKLPGDSPHEQLAVWWALYGESENDDAEWKAAVERVLELAVTKKKPQTLS